MKPFTVAEIMEVLKSLPPDLPALYYNGEYADYDPVRSIEAREVVSKYSFSPCTCYEDPAPGSPGGIKAVIFK